MKGAVIRWTDYMDYRLRLRGFDRERIEEIVRYSGERYLDAATGRRVAIGRHHGSLIMVPYELSDDEIVPVTVHATTREQINVRVKSGRLSHE